MKTKMLLLVLSGMFVASSSGFAQQAPKAVNKGNIQVVQAENGKKDAPGTAVAVDGEGAAGATSAAMGGFSAGVIAGLAVAIAIAASGGGGGGSTTGTR